MYKINTTILRHIYSLIPFPIKSYLPRILRGFFLEMEKFAGIKYREYDIIKCNTLQVDKNVNRRYRT